MTMDPQTEQRARAALVSLIGVYDPEPDELARMAAAIDADDVDAALTAWAGRSADFGVSSRQAMVAARYAAVRAVATPCRTRHRVTDRFVYAGCSCAPDVWVSMIHGEESALATVHGRTRVAG